MNSIFAAVIFSLSLVVRVQVSPPYDVENIIKSYFYFILNFCHFFNVY